MHPSSLSRRKFLALSGAAAAAGLFARFGASACPVVEDPESGKKLNDAINAFAGDLYGRLTRDEKGSLFFSPFSIEAALAMTAAGARGETLTEMEKTLHLPDEPHAAFGNLINHLSGTNLTRGEKRGYELSVANAIWAHKDFPWHKEFAELTTKHYGTGLIEADFNEPEAARKRINDWVEKQTKEKIKDLIASGIIKPLTRMVLTNAIYFKSAWLYTFDKKQTKDAAFTRADGTKADAPFMHQTRGFNYGTVRVGSEQKVQVLELPYSGYGLSMLVYLPEKADGANRLVLTKDDIAAPKLERHEVKVWLPRFKTESQFLLNVPLEDLGMKQAFTHGKADFTGMSPEGKKLFISAVIHKAFVDVYEEGTEAAAATAVVADLASAVTREATFRADRPFVYAIRDNKTGTALFMGRYSGPV